MKYIKSFESVERMNTLIQIAKKQMIDSDVIEDYFLDFKDDLEYRIKINKSNNGINPIFVTLNKKMEFIDDGVNGELCESGGIYVDPAGRVMEDGKVWNGNGEIIKL